MYKFDDDFYLRLYKEQIKHFYKLYKFFTSVFYIYIMIKNYSLSSFNCFNDTVNTLPSIT